ncbi:hypothetical protein HAX54_017444, partial [Datura stramonium]|nr:hypothetical protein [Datura stramonium]
AYSMIMSDESQKFVMATIGILASNPSSMQGYELAICSRNGSNQSPSLQGAHDSGMYARNGTSYARNGASGASQN